MKRLNQQDINRAYMSDDFVPKKSKKERRQERMVRHIQSAEDFVPGPVFSPLPQLRQDPNQVPIRAWAENVGAAAWRQLGNVAQLPIVHPHGLAVMPDVHVGNGACVGSVIPTRGALVPSTVGLDAGCGMVAVKLDLQGHQLPDTLRQMRFAIEKVIPLGTGGVHKEIADVDAWGRLEGRYNKMVDARKGLYKRTTGLQLGTLGAGNHFVEVCLDEKSFVWVMIHSGSRGVGNLIGKHFIDQAYRRTQQEGIILPDKGLGWLTEGTPEFMGYEEALLWAQDYAKENRLVMLKRTLNAIEGVLGKPVRLLAEAVNCHHNYATREQHFGEDLWITRKGAIRAGVGEYGIIPGSMGAESFIVKGKGQADSYCSCSHGAGRKMSRAMARDSFTTADLRKQTANVECRKDREVVDEIPAAYKDIRHVMSQQQDLVEVMHTLKQVICIKGA